MSHTGIFYKPSLLWRTAHGQRLHAQPTRGLSEVAYRHYVIDNLTEEIDVIAVRVEIGCANSLILAVLRTREQGTYLSLQIFVHATVVHHHNSFCIAGARFILPLC